MSFPPTGPTTVNFTIPGYLYVQYDDDPDVQSIFDAYNAYCQGYLDYANNLNFPVYTNGNITGPLLDWLMTYFWGFPRPGIPVPGISGKGDYNTYEYNLFEYNQFNPGTAPKAIPTTDDIYKRCATWRFFKGDGKQCSPLWLKKRIHRFLNYPNGTWGPTEWLYDVSIHWTGYQKATIVVPNNTMGNVFQAVAQAGIIELPFQTQWTVQATATPYPTEGFGFFGFGVDKFG